MNSTPLISVIVPVYNVEKYLAECLDSVIGQTYRNLEIIAVNDGSTDDSLNILNGYAAKDGRIIVISKDNGGLSSARNAGLNKASGEYVAFVDSDDYIAEDCFERVIKAFDDDIDIVSFSYARMDQNGKSYINRCNLFGKQMFFEGIIFEQPWNVWCKVFKLKDLKKYGVFFLEGRLYEDLDFISRFYFLKRPTIMYLNNCMYFYRVSDNSIMSNTVNKKEGMAIHHIFLLDNIYTFLNKYSKFEENKKDFMRLCEYCFKSAVGYSPAQDVARCYAEMTSRLRRYDLDYKDFPLLDCLSKANYSIELNMDTTVLKLKGLERIFCIKKERGQKVLRILGRRLCSF